SKQKNLGNVALFISIVGIALFSLAYIIVPFFTQDTYRVQTLAEKIKSQDEAAQSNTPEIPVTRHVATPVPVKGIYMTACVAGTPSLRNKLVELIKTTEINSVVI